MFLSVLAYLYLNIYQAAERQTADIKKAANGEFIH